MKCLAVLGLLSSATAVLVSNGASLTLGAINYFVSPHPQGEVVNGQKIDSLPQAFGFAPVTVVADDVEESSLETLFKSWTAKDDVWQPDFLSAVFFVNHHGNKPTRKSLYKSAASSLVLSLKKSSKIPSGPYFLDTSSGNLHQALRLYRDSVGAFSASLLQSPKGDSFQTLSAQVPASDELTVGVPSRLYFTPSPKKPLAGVRIGVKELYDLAGVRKSNGNRAWWRLYPPANATAPCIQNLIDAGAIIVGYQKMSQFANGEQATADWVDYHAPFNPRGDAYNSPSSSSSGAGASIGAYEWLDIAIGSDTGGSIRSPAAVQGIFGNRPSTGLVALDGVMPMSQTLDTPGFLARDPSIWDVAEKALYGKNYTSYSKVKKPTKIYTYGFNGTHPLITNFAEKLVAFFGIDGLEELDLDAAWTSTGPKNMSNISLNALLGPTYSTLITKEQTKSVRDPFLADYAAAHDGRRPFINPVPLARWAWGDALPEGTYEAALYNKTLFMDWFNKEILPEPHDKDKCWDSILLYPGNTGTPSPRDTYLSKPGTPPLGFGASRISNMAEVPDSVFPLGDTLSNSTITGKEEPLPVAVDVVVARGCDGILPRLALDLVGAGVLNIPQAGRTLEGGEILLRRI